MFNIKAGATRAQHPKTQDWNRPWYRLRLTWFLCVAVALLVGILAQNGALAPSELLSRDWRMAWRGVQKPRARIVIIAIDEASLSDPKFSQPLMFWGDHHARVFQTLNEMGARAIGFDVVQPLLLGDYARPNPDQAQAQTIAETPQLVMSYTRNLLPDGRAKDVIPNKLLSTALALGGGRLGFANTTPDADGVVRRFAFTDSGDTTGESTDESLAFPLAVAVVAQGTEPVLGNREMRLGKQILQLDDERRATVDYIGPSVVFPRISYRDILRRPDAFRALVKDSVCLIGVTSYEFQDYHAVPLARLGERGSQKMMAGVEVHASIVHTILAGRNLRAPGIAATWMFIACAVLLALPLAWLPRIAWVVPSLLIFVAAWLAACVAAFSNWGLQLPLVAVALSFAASQIVQTTLRLWQENRLKRWVEDAFGRYVSPSVVAHLRQTPGALELGGIRREVTVLFSDIRGFTQLSEQLEPEHVTRFLNLYLQKMVEIIYHNGGTVDKFIGDGIMVIYNWPVEQPDHARRALQSAVAMQRAVADSALEWKEMGMPEIEIGIGIHTGPAILGNIGAAQRMEQTAIGDTVNVASRVESLCKTIGKPLGSNILISETTQRAASAVQSPLPNCSIIAAGQAQVRGRREAMPLFAVMLEKI